MNSPADSASDSQHPRFRVAPPGDRTFGDLAGEFSASYGLTPDPWQQLILDDWLSEKGGLWSALTCGLSVPRQNGKNGALEVRELFGMVGRGEKILHTAHQVKTAQKHFRRLKHFFGKKKDDSGAKFPELNALVEEVRNVNGQEAIYLKNGGSVEIVARSTGSGRGFTVDVIVCDEAQDMSDEDQEALLSTSSAPPLGNPQWIYMGTPPGPKVNGEVFTRVRSSALEGAERMCWHEWSAESGVDLDDASAWERANPGLITGRLLRSVIDGERASFSDEGFARERLGMWEEAVTSRVIDESSWLACRDELSQAVTDRVMAVDVAPDRSVASVAGAGRREDGRIHVELAESRTSVDWVAPWLAERFKAKVIGAVVVDKASAAASLVPALRREKVRVIETSSSDMAAACGQFYDEVMAGDLVHIGQPQLDAALAGARKRSMLNGAAWGWNRKSTSTDITPLVAATLAAWGIGSSTKPSKKRKRKVVVMP